MARARGRGGIGCASRKIEKAHETVRDDEARQDYLDTEHNRREVNMTRAADETQPQTASPGDNGMVPRRVRPSW